MDIITTGIEIYWVLLFIDYIITPYVNYFFDDELML